MSQRLGRYPLRCANRSPGARSPRSAPINSLTSASINCSHIHVNDSRTTALVLSYLTYRDPLQFGELEWVRQLEWYPALVLLGVVIGAGIVWSRPARCGA